MSTKKKKKKTSQRECVGWLEAAGSSSVSPWKVSKLNSIQFNSDHMLSLLTYSIKSILQRKMRSYICGSTNWKSVNGLSVIWKCHIVMCKDCTIYNI